MECNDGTEDIFYSTNISSLFHDNWGSMIVQGAEINLTEIIMHMIDYWLKFLFWLLNWTKYSLKTSQ